MNVKKRRFLLVGLTALVTFSSPVFGIEPEDLWRGFGKLSGEERQKALFAGAKAEGKVVFYANISADHLEVLRQDFEKRYSEIKLEMWRGSGERTSNRILTETRAERFDADVVGAQQ